MRFKRLKKNLKYFGLLLWVYYSSTILIVGGEFAYFLEEDRQKSVS